MKVRGGEDRKKEQNKSMYAREGEKWMVIHLVDVIDLPLNVQFLLCSYN